MGNSKLKILIVEDDKDLCDLLHDIIRDEGFIVHKAYDGDIALSGMVRFRYDLMIVDNKLNTMSGISVIEQSMVINPRLKTIMLSAYGNTRTKLRARDLGVYDFIDKPFDVNFLIRRVRELAELPNNNSSLIYS
jgi:DNA-binding response OmpR family regulator